nr:MAG TPA: hypothetical protein [Caudoviricetes sp.]
MNDLPYFGLDAVEHNKLPEATKVFYTTDNPQYLHIRVPSKIANSYTLSTVHKVYTGRDIHREYEEQELDIDMSIVFTHEGKSIWYDFLYNELTPDIGHNIYKLTFFPERTSDRVVLYFEFILAGTPQNRTYKYVKERVNES